MRKSNINGRIRILLVKVPKLYDVRNYAHRSRDTEGVFTYQPKVLEFRENRNSGVRYAVYYVRNHQICAKHTPLMIFQYQFIIMFN